MIITIENEIVRVVFAFVLITIALLPLYFFAKAGDKYSYSKSDQ